MILRPVIRPVLRPPLTPVGLRAGGSGGTDADAAAWAAAVTANGGTYSVATLSAVSTFCKAAKASGYWTKLNRINLFAGDQLAAALVPLKAGGGSAKDTAVNFVSGDYTEATGLTGNGTTKYLKTGLIPSASLTLNSRHYAIYNRSSLATGSAAMAAMGCNDGTLNDEADLPFTDGVAYSGIGASSYATANPTEPYGFLVGSRTASNLTTEYQAGSSIATASTADGGLPTVEVYVAGFNNNGAAKFFSAAPIAAYSIGSGLTAADVTAYTAHLEAFQDALSRGVA